MQRALSHLVVFALFTASPILAGEPVGELRFEPRAVDFTSLAGTVIMQHIVDTKRFMPGAMLLWLPKDTDLTTVDGGIRLGRVVDKHLSWVPASKYAIALVTTGGPEIAIVPLAGWEIGVDYAIRTRETIKDHAGRSLTDGTGTWLMEAARQSSPPARPPAPQRVAADTATLQGAFPGGQTSGWHGA